MMTETGRDLKGYGRRRPFADWPGGSRVTVGFVLNYEEGDFKFAMSPCWMSGGDFLHLPTRRVRSALPRGGPEPKIMSVGLHARLVGRPGRADALARFLEYIQHHDKVWICRRVEIARHWITKHPCTTPSALACSRRKFGSNVHKSRLPRKLHARV